SPASGQYHADLRKEFTQRIETLLAEEAAVQVSAVPASNTAAVAQNSQ
ncbi:MAG: hypothetical protein JNL55_22885, partial [Steroidobacter sp.]|nr:hypothetical protein [Steroidobacter sp.]